MEEKALNFDVIKPGLMEKFKEPGLTAKEIAFLDSLKDPVILSLLNDYLFECVSKIQTYDDLHSIADKIAEDFPKWIESKGYYNL